MTTRSRISTAAPELAEILEDPPYLWALCKTRKKLIAEYALRNTRTPIGVSEYHLTRAIPAALKNSLPSIKDLEKKLGEVKEGKP